MPEVVGRLGAVLRKLSEDDDGLAGIVVGLPSHLDGRPHEHAVRVRAIAEALELRTGLAVTLQDERLTSVEAEQRLALRERDWRKRKARLDAAAAAIILQDYLDAQLGAREVRRQKTEVSWWALRLCQHRRNGRVLRLAPSPSGRGSG